MLEPSQKLAIFMEGNVTGQPAKMGHGIIRYSPNPIVCVIDASHSGSDMATVANMPRPVPIVGSIQAAVNAGAEVLVLGIAPAGGLVPASWMSAIDEAVASGMSVLNGLHDFLAPRYPNLKPGQWIWDVRVEPSGIGTASGAAAKLNNRRLLLIGTDMSIGKMTAGLEIHRMARERGIDAAFVATGQIGITLTGRGVPLDAIRLDFAPGSIEREVLRTPDADLIVVEGQGSIIHPASSATLPLVRGSCPTHFVLCHRAGQQHLYRIPEVKIPPLADVIRLYEDIAGACRTFARPKTVAVALNTFHIESNDEAFAACKQVEDDLGIPCVDPVRHGAGRLVDLVMSD
jgi:uncharacterized NAD-dependent epimerase/dehydratase family protein